MNKLWHNIIMLKRILILFLILISTQTAFSRSIFAKEDDFEVDKTQPFFINIYAKNDYDVNGDFEENILSITPQVQIFSQKIEENTDNESSNFFISAKRSLDVNYSRSQVDKVELTTGYTFGKWDLLGGVSQEIISGKNQYLNYISFEPNYKINDVFSLYGGLSHSITNKFDQTSFGIKYSPSKFKRLVFKLGVSNYTKQFLYYKNRLNFETIFKI